MSGSENRADLASAVYLVFNIAAHRLHNESSWFVHCISPGLINTPVEYVSYAAKRTSLNKPMGKSQAK